MTKFLGSGGAQDDPSLLYAARAMPLLLAPFAPHIAEELWERMDRTTSVHLERWPEPIPAALSVEAIVLVVQVNGKIRARIETAPGLDEAQALALALAHPGVRKHLAGNAPRKRIYVQDKLLNLVA
jgi:leucyl-tRNA synthetase